MEENINAAFGCKVQRIKEATTVYEQIIDKDKRHGIVVVSTCYFLPSTLEISERVFGYLLELINNIESFSLKINKFATTPAQWIYRVYIDNVIFMISSILGNISGKTPNINTNNNTTRFTYKQLIQNKNILNFISLFLTKYTEHMRTFVGDKYKQIEIFTYENTKLTTHLKSDANSTNSTISGHIGTFGTLMRYHVLTDTRISVCIFRNCSDNFTPLDILIQDYWIIKSDKEFMEYYSANYNFKLTHNEKENYIMSLIYKYNDTGKSQNNRFHKTTDHIAFLINRSFAGLLSCKSNEKHSKYVDLIKKFTDNYINVQGNIYNTNSTFTESTKYMYGIDEAIIQYLFPTIRNGTLKFNSEFIPTKPKRHIVTIKAPIIETNQNTLAISVDTQNTQPTNDTSNKIEKIYEVFFNSKKYSPNSSYILGILNSSKPLPDKYNILHNLLSSLPFDDVNSIECGVSFNDISLMLKSIDYKYKYTFVFKYDKQGTPEKQHSNPTLLEQYNKIFNNDTHKLSEEDKFCKLITIDITETRDINVIIDEFIKYFAIVFSQENFKPVIIYPKNLYEYDGYSYTVKNIKEYTEKITVQQAQNNTLTNNKFMYATGGSVTKKTMGFNNKLTKTRLTKTRLTKTRLTKTRLTKN